MISIMASPICYLDFLVGHLNSEVVSSAMMRDQYRKLANLLSFTFRAHWHPLDLINEYKFQWVRVHR